MLHCSMWLPLWAAMMAAWESIWHQLSGVLPVTLFLVEWKENERGKVPSQYLPYHLTLHATEPEKGLTHLTHGNSPLSYCQRFHSGDHIFQLTHTQAGDCTSFPYSKECPPGI